MTGLEGSDDDRCVICRVSIQPTDGGLCDEHKYDEQWRRSESG